MTAPLPTPGGADDDLASLLAGFLQPLLLTDVLVAMRTRRLLHAPVSESDERSVPGFRWQDLESLLARDVRNGADYRFFKGGKAVNATALGLIDQEGALRPQALSRIIGQGITIVGKNLEHKLPAFWPLLCALQRCTGGKISLAFVASFECPKALPLHYDYPDNIVVQTEGRKHWHLYGDPIPGSGVQRTLEQVPDAPIRQLELSRGDLLFIPSGLHHVCSSERDSLHLSVLIEWPTGLQLLERVSKLGVEDEAVCEPLRRFADEASLRESEMRIKARLHALIDVLDTRILLDDLAGKAAREMRLPLPRCDGAAK